MTASLAFPLEHNAAMSYCGRYRYLLTRQIGPGLATATFVMLNPSTADATNDDPTVRRCIGFARRWGCGRLRVLNLFALRATNPAQIRRVADPVGPENRDWFVRALANVQDGPVICAWGVHGEHMGQDRVVLGWLAEIGAEPMALGTTKRGHPKHPLYLRNMVTVVPFTRPPA